MNVNVAGAFVYFTIPIFGGINITQTTVSSFLVSLFLIILCIKLGKNLKKRPGGFQVVVEKLVNTFSSYQGISTDFTGGWNYGMNAFSQSHAVFATGNIGASLWATADLDDDMGFLPYPKWDEAQEEYYTMVDGSHQALAVPTTATKMDMIGAVTEVLNAESWKLVTPAYYDVALKVKATRDMESVAMLDLIVNSRIFDFGYVYDGWEGPCFLLENLVRAKNTNFESEYAKKEKTINKRYETVIDFFENYEG